MTIPRSRSLGQQRVNIGDNIDVIWQPRTGGRGRPLVLLTHGQLQNAWCWINYGVGNDPPPGTVNQAALAELIAAAGFTVAAVYDTGPGWGNVPSIGLLEHARTAFAPSVGCTQELMLVGASMGGAVNLRYMIDHAPYCKAAIQIMAAADFEYFRTVNPAGSNVRNHINTAWGMPTGSTIATAPLPPQANPMTNVAAIAAAGPRRWYYSEGDTLAIPEFHTLPLAAALGDPVVKVSDTSGHNDTQFGDVLAYGEEIVQFLDEAA